jgi:hypothetical protein
MNAKRAGLGALFFVWLWGVPFLLIVGLTRRNHPPEGSTPQFATVTDRWLTTAVVLNVLLPVAGLLLARLLRNEFWTRHFKGAFVGVAAFFLLFPLMSRPAPEDPAPAPRVSRCVQFSGGHTCPGG